MLEQRAHLGFDARQIVGMHTLAPEIGVVEIFARRIAEQPRDVVADKGRSEIALGLEAIDDRGRGIEQPGQAVRGRSFDLGHVPVFFLQVFALCVGQDSFDDIRHLFGSGAVAQHLSKRCRRNLGVFSRGRHASVVRDTVKARAEQAVCKRSFRGGSPVSMAQPYVTLRNSCEGLKSPSENLERRPKAWLRTNYPGPRAEARGPGNRAAQAP